MRRLVQFAFVTALLLIPAAAQSTTTYTIQPGTVCRQIQTCTITNLSGTDGSGNPSSGYLETATSLTQFVYQSPTVKAQYCQPTTYLAWTVQATGSLYNFTASCPTDPIQTSQDGPGFMTIAIQAHSHTILTKCGVRYCSIVVWIVDEGNVTLSVG